METPLVFLKHDFGRLDDNRYGVSLLQLEFFGTSPGNDAFDYIFPDANYNVGHDLTEMNLGNFTNKLVSS